MDTIIPVYLPKMVQDDVDAEEYNLSVTMNEEQLNQNLNLLYRLYQNLQERMAAMAAKEG